jgi:alpha-pyrone synthase
MNTFALLGLGTAVPEHCTLQTDAAEAAKILAGPSIRDSKWLQSVYANSGVERRYQVLGRELLNDLIHGERSSDSPFLPNTESDGVGPTTSERMALYGKHAGNLGIQAAHRAINQAGIEPSSISHLITVSCTGFQAPGVDLVLVEGLGLIPTVQRVHVGFMGCHGAINGLRVADALAKSDPDAVILLVAVELCSLHYHYGNQPDQAVANALFADGAAAIVGSASKQAKLSLRATGSQFIPKSAHTMSWNVGDHGFAMTLSRSIPGLIREHLRPALESWLQKHQLQVDQIANWAIHPGGPKILDAVQEALGLSEQTMCPSRNILRDFGNMSSPTVLFIVELMQKTAPTGPMVLLGFGPGLVVEMALLERCDTNSKLIAG